MISLWAVLMVSAIAAAADMKAARKAAADRPRPLIFNNDGCDVVYEMKQPTAEDLLRCRTAALAGSQVSSIFYCTISSPFGVFTHHTKIGEHFATRDGPFKNNQTAALLEAGIDPLKVMADWCRSNRVELFWSMRVNDVHDASSAEYGPIMFRSSKLKAEHPEWLLGTADKPPRYGRWTSVDYGRDEICDLAFRYVEEVCRNYDIDGVELDFFRHAMFFKTPAAGGSATKEELGRMTALLRRIRAMADEVGAARGRPILIALRVPDSVEYCKTIGLDLETWLKDDLFDLLITGGYAQMQPVEDSVQLARQFGVKVYPSLDESRVRDESARKMRSTLLAYRGRAAEAWASGVDGIYLFNYFNAGSPLWRELGDPRALNALDKDYFASVRGLGSMYFPHAAFQRAPTLNPGNPITLADGAAASVEIRIVEDFAAAEKSGKRPAVTIRLLIAELRQAADVEVRFNDKVVTGARMAGGWLEVSLDVAAVRRGKNTVSVRPAEGTKLKRWNDLQVLVRYHPRDGVAP